MSETVKTITLELTNKEFHLLNEALDKHFASLAAMIKLGLLTDPPKEWVANHDSLCEKINFIHEIICPDEEDRKKELIQ